MSRFSPVKQSASAPVDAPAADPRRSSDRARESTVFVVDSDAAACNAIRSVVGTMNLPCEVFSSGQEFLDAYDPTRPGCLVMELRIPGVSGLQIQRRLRTDGVRMPVVFLTSHADVSIAVEAMRSGAVHFLEKPFRTHELWGAIQEAIEVDLQRRQTVAWHGELNQRLAGLTTKEREVLELLGQGKSSREIGETMDICSRTVEVHRARTAKKLGVSSLRELVDIAILTNIRDPHDPRPGNQDWQGE